MSSVAKPILEADLHAFADGFATAERRAEIVAYLEADPEAARRMTDWCTQNEAIRRTMGKAISHPLPEFIPAAEPCRLNRPKTEAKTVAFEPARKAEGSPHVRRAFKTRWRSPPSVVAGVLLLGVGAGWLGANASNNLRLLSPSPIQEPAPAVDTSAAFAEDAMVTYQTVVAGTQFPTELSAHDKARLAPWLSNHLGEALALPDTAPLGYAIVAGHIVPTHAGAAAMLLLTNAAGDHLTLTVARPHGSIEGAAHYREGAGTGVIVWQADGHILALAGLAGRARLSMFAQKIGAVERIGSSE
jgi:anti-sigma factor RsiW